MAKGLRVPVGVDNKGGSMTVEGDDDLLKVIMLALSDNDNENAFQQDIGLSQDAVFAIARPDFRARVLTQLFRIFAIFERFKLAKLNRASLAWERTSEGEQTLSFEFVNLESDTTITFRRAFTGGR
jgi:hypothetical protein